MEKERRDSRGPVCIEDCEPESLKKKKKIFPDFYILKKLEMNVLW